MQVSLTPKQQFIEAFFTNVEHKVERLQALRSNGFSDEAFTLCLLYIDRLASSHYGGKYGQNRKSFCRALKELSDNPLFGMIHPQHLLEQARHTCPSAVSIIESIASPEPHALLEEDNLAKDIKNSVLADSDRVKLISNLWRASIASITYDSIRNAEVHGPGSGGLSFDESIYQGKVGVTLSFQVFYDALRTILQRIREISMKSSEWFGNPNYVKERR